MTEGTGEDGSWKSTTHCKQEALTAQILSLMTMPSNAPCMQLIRNQEKQMESTQIQSGRYSLAI
ncbi:hypothetical protein BG003_008644 [Podila horticola]|nr:hypothetical protein BG003_008644 [Podila horticola]